MSQLHVHHFLLISQCGNELSLSQTLLDKNVRETLCKTTTCTLPFYLYKAHVWWLDTVIKMNYY